MFLKLSGKKLATRSKLAVDTRTIMEMLLQTLHTKMSYTGTQILYFQCALTNKDLRVIYICMCMCALIHNVRKFPDTLSPFRKYLRLPGGPCACGVCLLLPTKKKNFGFVCHIRFIAVGWPFRNKNPYPQRCQLFYISRSLLLFERSRACIIWV